MTNQIKKLHHAMWPINNMIMKLEQDLPEHHFNQVVDALQKAEKALQDGLRCLEHGSSHIINKKPFYKGIDGSEELLGVFHEQVITHKILFAAVYNDGYDSQYFVLSTKDGELYQNYSDYWNPEKVTIDELERGLRNDEIGHFYEYNNTFKAELAQFLEIDLLV